MLECWFIRHGESESNAGLRTVAVADIALTSRGIAQSQHIPAAFTTPPSLIVTSPFLRTKQTALPTIAQFRHVRQEEWPVHEFSCLALPQRCATTKLERRPLVDAFWERCDPLYVAGDGAESFAGLIARVKGTLERIRDQNDELVAVFSHGLFTRVLLWYVLNVPARIDSASMRQCWFFLSSFSMPNASIFKLYVKGAEEIRFSNFITAHLPAHLI